LAKGLILAIHHVDLKKDWIPVVPLSHYLSGAIAVDVNGNNHYKK